MSTSLDAAQKAAAEVKAKLIAAGQLSNGKKNGSPQTGTVGSKSTRAAGAVALTKSRLGLFHTEEVVINNVSMSARNYLTRTSTQEEITKISGASVSTRGRYLSAEEVAKLSSDTPSSERPLYLHIQGANEQDVKVAVGRVMHIILEHNHGNKTALSNGRGHSRFQGRGRFTQKFSSGPRFSVSKLECNASFGSEVAPGSEKSQSRKSVHERLGLPPPNGGVMRPPAPLMDPNNSADVRMRLSVPPYGAPPADASAKVSFLPPPAPAPAPAPAPPPAPAPAPAPAPTPLQREKVFLPELPGMTTAEVYAALAGENENNLQFIREETGVDVVMRGSGSLDALTSTLQPEALHFYLEHTDVGRFNEAKSLVVNLAQTVITDLQQQLLVQRQVQQQVREQHVQLHQLAQQQIQQLQQQQLRGVQQQEVHQVQQQPVHAEQQVLQVQQQQLQQIQHQQIQVQQVHHHQQQQQQVQLVEQQQQQQVQQQHLIQQHLASDQNQQVSHVVVSPAADQQPSHVVLHQVQFQLPQPASEQAQQQLNNAAHEIAYQFAMGSQTSALSSTSDAQAGRDNPGHGTTPAQISANFVVEQTSANSNSIDLPVSAAGLSNSSVTHSQVQHAYEVYMAANKESPARQASQEQPQKEGDQSALQPQTATGLSSSTGVAVGSHDSTSANPQSSNYNPSSNGIVPAVTHPVVYAVSTQHSETCAPPAASQPSVTVPYFVTIPSYPPPATSIAVYDATQPPPAIVPSASYTSISVASYAAPPPASYATSAASHSTPSVFYTVAPSAATYTTPTAASYATPTGASYAAAMYATSAPASAATSTARAVDATTAVNSLATPVTASYNAPVGAPYAPPAAAAALYAPPPAIAPPNAYATSAPSSYSTSATSNAAPAASALASYAAAAYAGPGTTTYQVAASSSVPTAPVHAGPAAASYSQVVASYAPTAVSSAAPVATENAPPTAPYAPLSAPQIEPSITSDSSTSTAAPHLTLVHPAQSSSHLASYLVSSSACQPSEAASHLASASVAAQQPNLSVTSYSTPGSAELPTSASSTTSLHQAQPQYHTHQEDHQQTFLQQNSVSSLSLFQISHMPPPHIASGDQSNSADSSESHRNGSRPHDVRGQLQYVDSQQQQLEQEPRVLQLPAKENEQTLQQEQQGYAQSLYQQQIYRNRQLEPLQELHGQQLSGHDRQQFQHQQLQFENRPHSETTVAGPQSQQNEAYDPSQPYQEHPLSSEPPSRDIHQRPLESVQHHPSEGVGQEQGNVHHQGMPCAEQFGSEVPDYQHHANYQSYLGCPQEHSAASSHHQYQTRPGEFSGCKQRDWHQQSPWDSSYQSQGLTATKSGAGPGGIVAKAAPQRLVYDSGFSGVEAESAAHVRQQLAVAELRQHPPPPPPPPPPAPSAPRLDYHQPIINPEFSSRQGHSIHSNTGRSRCSAGPAAGAAGLSTQRGEPYQRRAENLNITGSRPPLPVAAGGSGQRYPPPDPAAEKSSSSRTDSKTASTSPVALNDAAASDSGRSNAVTPGLRRYANYPFGSIGPMKRRRF